MGDEILSTRLTQGVISKAFEVAKSSVPFKEGNLMLIDEPHYEMAIGFLKSSFILDEPINKSVGLHWCQELEALVVETLRFNLSFMLVDPATNDVMGMRMMRVQGKEDDSHIDVNTIHNIPFQKLISFFHYLEEQANYFQKYDATEAIQFFGLGVAEKYRRRGIGSRLMEVGLKIVENLGILPICIKGDASSNYSKKIYGKTNLEYLAEVRFDDYKVDGELVIKDTGEHKSMKVYGKRLQ